MKNSEIRVLVAMSGGIDSSVVAKLLKERGYEVIGVTFRTADSLKESCIAKERGCCDIESVMQARQLARQMGIAHHILDLRGTFKNVVIDNFVSEYMRGRTPNPCVRCNKYIKWGELLRFADELGCQYIATGHYAELVIEDERHYLQVAKDTNKDQTYFLWMLQEEHLARTLFPLGEITKSEVREMADRYEMPNLVHKRESEEICFIADDDYRKFLSEMGCPSQQGHFIDKYEKVLGVHRGFQNYTIGQRKGLGIALGERYYVQAINPKTNEVLLGLHDELYTSRIDISGVQWVNERVRQTCDEGIEVQVRIRYRSPLYDAVVGNYCSENNELTLRTLQPVWGVTPGQSAVFYKNGKVIGGGLCMGSEA